MDEVWYVLKNHPYIWIVLIFQFHGLQLHYIWFLLSKWIDLQKTANSMCLSTTKTQPKVYKCFRIPYFCLFTNLRKVIQAQNEELNLNLLSFRLRTISLAIHQACSVTLRLQIFSFCLLFRLHHFFSYHYLISRSLNYIKNL